MAQAGKERALDAALTQIRKQFGDGALIFGEVGGRARILGQRPPIGTARSQIFASGECPIEVLGQQINRHWRPWRVLGHDVRPPQLQSHAARVH